MTLGDMPELDHIDLSQHAVEQPCERARRELALAHAREELGRLIGGGEMVADPPAWARAAGTMPIYLVIADSLALPLAPQGTLRVTTTCLVKATRTRRRRDERSAYKARPAAKRARRRTSW